MKLLREPLLHFVLLGAAIFAAHSLLANHSVDRPAEIIVTQGKLENLVIGFTRTWQRPPTDEELQGLIRDYVREEAAYRKALAMGLDRDDTIVRRRLRQKLEFISDDLVAQTEPTDANLQAFLAAHPEDFRKEPALYIFPGVLKSARTRRQSSTRRNTHPCGTATCWRSRRFEFDWRSVSAGTTLQTTSGRRSQKDVWRAIRVRAGDAKTRPMEWACAVWLWSTSGIR